MIIKYFVLLCIMNVFCLVFNAAHDRKLCTVLETWLSDGYRWKQNGTSKIPGEKPEVRKIHYNLKTLAGLTGEFKRIVYRPLLHSSTVKCAVVHYIGNEKIATDFPHGMEKCTYIK